MHRKNYDIIIVGAGVAGSALAHGLSTLPRSKPLRIALVERSLAEPDRIVGELLQPGGVLALKKLGIDWCLEGIDAVTERGYCVIENGRSVHIPYPEPHEGRSFHHGRFIMRLREAAAKANGVEVLEGTVTGLIEAGKNKKVVGVRVTRKGGDDADQLFADVTIIADGCFSNHRNTVMGSSAVKPTTKSHFFGAVLEDVRLPIPNHGTVALVRGYGPVLIYQIGSRETRILIDLKIPLPSDPKACDNCVCFALKRLTIFSRPKSWRISSPNFRPVFIFQFKSLWRRSG
jgi:squalene monooxygenase